MSISKTKLMQFLQLYRNEGMLDYGEVAAIYGAVKTIQQQIKENTSIGKEFVEEYGTVSREGIESLLREKE